MLGGEASHSSAWQGEEEAEEAVDTAPSAASIQRRLLAANLEVRQEAKQVAGGCPPPHSRCLCMVMRNLHTKILQVWTRKGISEAGPLAPFFQPTFPAELQYSRGGGPPKEGWVQSNPAGLGPTKRRIYRGTGSKKEVTGATEST